MIYHQDPGIRLRTVNDSDIGYDIWVESRGRHAERQPGGLIRAGEEVLKEEDYRKRVDRMALQYANHPTFTFEIRGSVLFRDLCFNLNRTAQWAYSTRLDHSLFTDVERCSASSYPVSSEYKHKKQWDDAFYQFLEANRATKNTDESRLLMPYSMSTRFWWTVNQKTLLGFLGMLKIRMPFFYETYGRLLLSCLRMNTGRDYEDIIPDYVDDTIGQYFRSESRWVPGFEHVGDFVLLRANMGLLLHSQFLRQSETNTKGLYDAVAHEHARDFSGRAFTASTEIPVTYLADQGRFNRTISNRACAFSMSDGEHSNSWSSILNLVLREDMTPREFTDLLPCSFEGNKLCRCKFWDDLKFREEGGTACGILSCPIAHDSPEMAKARVERSDVKVNRLYVKAMDWLEPHGKDLSDGTAQDTV